MENKTSVTDTQEEQEIDLVEIIRKLWSERKVIIKITVLFAVLGILVAFFSAKEYTAQCTMVPQTGEKMKTGNLGGLAAMAGINLGSIGGDEVLSPKIYPKILASVPFQKDLMKTQIKFEGYDESINVLDYYTDEKYQKFSLFETVLKYTIGLPGLISKAIQGQTEHSLLIVDSSMLIETLTVKESECVKALKDQVALNVNDKEGYVTLSANMPEAYASAQLASRVQYLLQKYITEFKIEKVKANLEFVEGRYSEAKREYEKKQQELAAFRDANRSFASAVARTTEERLNNECNLLFNVYNELAKQREQANIQVKETTPIFTIVDPVTVPTERSKPKRGLICIAFIFLGGFIAIGWILISPFVKKMIGKKQE